MKSIALILLILICPLVNIAQTFQKKTSWKDNSFATVDAQWVDLDNDSLLDVVISGKSKTQGWQIKPFRNGLGLGFTPAPITTYNATVSDYKFTDVNRDNRTDVVLIGKKQNGVSVITSLINQTNFGFIPNEKTFPEASTIHFADLDNDGLPDVILTENQSLKILKATTSGYTQKYDSSGLIISGLDTQDFDKDGQVDIVVTGENQNGSPFLFTLINNGKFKFIRQNIHKPHSGILETGDLNHDGLFDFIIGGADNKIRSYIRQGNNFTLSDSLTGYHATQLFSADLNSDGLIDLSFSGRQPNGDRFSLIQQNDKTLVPLDTTGLLSQQFGDYDRDGDLDLLRVIDSASYHVFQVFENTTLNRNANPSPASPGFAINTPYGTFIYWEQATDDLTPKEALTYDLYLSSISGNQILTPEFDLASQQRKRVVHGSQTTNHFAIIKGLADQQYNYLIQAVDNAFNGSNCKGGTVLPCFTISHEYVQACKNSSVTLTTETLAYWFSLSEGLIALSNTHNFIATKNDTLYSFVPKNNDCSKNKIWIITVNEGSRQEKETRYVCKNTTFKLGVAPGWKNVEWNLGQGTMKGDTISIIIDGPRTITATATSDGGCSYRKDFELKLSEPVLSVNGEAFTITKGQSVTLSASGGENYNWQPSSGLNNALVADPVASPNETTEYTVIATDSIGCTVSAKIIVYVEAQGFIPNLFTPNGDGKNDELKIYGVTEASQFRFSIFNREGTTVYETKDINQAVRVGWNGTHGGAIQNSGLYYWKVEGKLSTGQALTLNGKSTGSILLVK